MAKLPLFDRIGMDVGKIVPVEEAIVWAAANGVRFLDVQTDLAPNAMETMLARAPAIRELCAEHGVELGLHSLSGVNIAELSPFVRDAADAYLRAYIDLARDTGAGWVIVHAGYHFTGDYKARREAGLERLKRALDYAERQDVLLLLENTNREPDTAEVHYLCCTLEEIHYYFGALQSPHLGMAFTANHAHLYPEGVAGFVAEIDFSRVREVRLADCHGTVEEHLCPGEGSMDFAAMFEGIEARGFTGHYMNQFGTLQDMLDARPYLVARAAERGVV